MLDHFRIVLAVAAFIHDPEKGIIIIKKSAQEKIDGGLWTVPGGKVDATEPIIEALKREVQEEVGLKVTDYEWIGEDVFESNGYSFHGEHFLCKVSSSENVILEEKLEEYKWIKEEELDDQEFHPNIRKELGSVFEKIKNV